MTADKLKICICTPATWPFVWLGHHSTVVNMILSAPKNVELTTLYGKLFPIDANRNALVKAALETDAEYLLWLDMDNVFPANTIEKLFKVNADIASGVYFKKKEPYPAVPGRALDEHYYRPLDIVACGGRVVNADLIGMGCALIRRSVFENLPHPWFRYAYNIETDEWSVSEDVAFCKAARRKGYEIKVDTSLICGHVRPEAIGYEHHLYGREVLKLEAARDKQVAAYVWRPDYDGAYLADAAEK